MPMNVATRTRTLVTASAAVLLLAGGAVPSQAGQGHGSDGLDRFVTQELDFGECDAAAVGEVEGEARTVGMERAECATLEVPLDYADPDGRTVRIAVLRVPARGDDPEGSIVLNPGGPGAGGTSLAPQLAEVWASSRITESFDLVGFDPRGTGASTPAVDCYADARRERDAPLFTPLSGVEEFTDKRAKALVKQCAKGSGGKHVLAHLGTRDVARDMDVMREVLGDDKLTYAGLSYGTRLGAVYAQMFPEKVRALVLDGAIDPTADKRAWRVSQFAGMQGAFDGMVDLCVQQADCPLGTDPDKALDVYLDLVRDLDEHPVPTAGGRELNTVKAMDGVFAGLYSSAAWPFVVDALKTLRSGDGERLMALRDAYHLRGGDGVYADVLEANLAINCVDDDRLSPRKETAYKRAVLDAAPFMDPGHTVDTTDPCAVWPGGDPVRFDADDVSDELPATLVVSATGDPATPYRDGVRLAETLGSSLLTVEADQHGVITEPDPCVEEVVADYLVDLRLPAEGARCTR
jgi:pimeloyl-ACP methyl ester carboxylesterase